MSGFSIEIVGRYAASEAAYSLAEDLSFMHGEQFVACNVDYLFGQVSKAQYRAVAGASELRELCKQLLALQITVIIIGA